MLQKAIFQKPAVIAQTWKPLNAGSGADGRPITSLRSTYLCLQCPSICTQQDRDSHWHAKRHNFSVESRSGCLYCQQCEDFVYDSTFEDLRLQSHIAQSTAGRRKRKSDVLDSDEDFMSVKANTAAAPCQAVGLRGLYNMGQTCFMSVILQSMLHNPLVRNFFLGDGHNPNLCGRESCVACAMDEIFTEFHSLTKADGFGAVSMLHKSWASEEALAGYQQQDAHEYLQSLLNQLHTSSATAPNTTLDPCDCIIHKLFCGKLQSTVTCENCRNVTIAEDPVMDLSLDLWLQSKRRKINGGGVGADASIRLQSCLDRFTSPEKLGSDDYTCQQCAGTQQSATKQLSIKRLPPVLCIQLKRFEHFKTNAAKLEAKLQFPLQLDMAPYTSRVKQHKRADAMTWFLFDDSKVTIASESQVLGADAYLLFYVVQTLN
ncbi:MAG: hypothetical protein M1819_006938 [Sarea resinae]|nr:MAG: hypothetical protein M1819_006938 [Sarea resinae]